MDLPPDWPPDQVLAQARLQYGVLLATGQLGWGSTPEVVTDLCTRFRNRMLRRLYTHIDFVAKRHNSWRFQHPLFAPKKSISFFRPTPRVFFSWDTTTSPFVALRAAHIHPRFRAWNLSI